KDTFCNRWLTTLLIDREKIAIDRETIRLSLEKHNIESRPLWKPMHMQPVYQDAPYYGTGVCDDLFDRGLCLPSGSNLSGEQLNNIKKELYTIFGY
ncbi:pyridoxal phosphate-dependent aminotransferase, partial [Fulvivirga sp. RKSG066]|uniref:DegT/DnrJ/EryC1/StrS family aminotransferase n=1 Tax=Fulvivirga aurantia TaxID=2529383 RepID=UPI001624A091